MVRGVTQGTPALVYSVNLNREASPTVAQSTLAIKADAARLLFKISCRDLAWAVIDSGIDARHPAFRLRDLDGKPVSAVPFGTKGGKAENHTRVVETYDFTEIDLLLDPDPSKQPAALAKRLKARSAETERAPAAARGAQRRSEPGPHDRLEPRRSPHPSPPTTGSTRGPGTTTARTSPASWPATGERTSSRAGSRRT